MGYRKALWSNGNFSETGRLMDFEAWTVDLPSLSATHQSGLSIEVEGDPRDPSNVKPGRFPAGLSGIEQVRLLRYGLEAIAKAAKSNTAKSSSRAAKKPAFVPPAHKPDRPVLSLKKRKKAVSE